jgi:hypothetical protein
MRFIVLVGGLLAFSSGHTLAQREQGVIVGVGTQSCAEFAKDYQANPKTAEAIYFAWAQGFMSGLNIRNGVLKIPRRDINAWPYDRQQRNIRQFCDQRPLSSYFDAAQGLFQALPEITPQSN